MNSDLNENAAWRTFGMLDGDEAASFDEATKHDPALKMACKEMEFLSAAIAVATSQPVVPQAGQLEKLHLRLGLNQARRTNWLGISGWAAAAALTLILLSHRTPQPERSVVKNFSIPNPSTSQRILPTPANPAPAFESPSTKELTAENTTPQNLGGPPKTKSSSSERILAKVEPRQLIQKIEVLQEKITQLQNREQQRLAVVPDMAWPIVMRMRPPRATTAKDNDIVALQQPTLTETLADALAAANDSTPPETIGAVAAKKSKEQPVLASNDPLSETVPSIYSIFNPATGTGQLVANGLPTPEEGQTPILVANTTGGSFNVGTIPLNGSAKQQFDFTLPADVILTGMSVVSESQVAGQAPVSRILFTSSPPPAP